MAHEIGSGPLWRIDGPPPVAPKYGLLQAARTSPLVRIVPDADEKGIERWINGVAMRPYPVDLASTWDACAIYGSQGGSLEKESGEQIPLPKFDAVTVYLPIDCQGMRTEDHDALKARAVAALGGVEGAAIEREFIGAETMVMNPHLADGQGTFPHGNVATNLANGLALLEEEIARVSGKAGMIHLPPGMATAAGTQLIEDEGGALYTKGGTLIIPGSGYVDTPAPAKHTAAHGTQSWAYATGPVDIRRSEVFTVPETPAQALDRGSGATRDNPNELIYRAERYYLVTWDTAVQAAVLIDRCLATC